MAYIKRLILIQQDQDGQIHAASTGPDTLHLAIWNDDGDEAVEFDAGFVITDTETWSDWCHAVLMMFHSENAEYSELMKKVAKE